LLQAEKQNAWVLKPEQGVFEALKICPELALVPADFNKYFDVSKKFLNICKDYSPFTELFSIDEVFMDVTKTANLFGDLIKLLKQLKKELKTKSANI